MTAKIMTIEDLLKSCHMRQLDDQQKVVDAVADLRFENRILVEALRNYTCEAWPWYTRDNQPSEECYAPWEPAEDALKKTGNLE